MPRHPRIHSSEVLYHILSRGNNRQTIFHDSCDFEKFISLTKQCGQKYPHTIYAYVLMSNHFHLLMSIKDISTARIMQSILTAYTHYFNRKYTRVGHLFQGRYKAIVCDREPYAMELVRYIHLNPLRAKIVNKLDDWKWSGHNELTGNIDTGLIDKSFVTDQFGAGKNGFKKYISFMNDGLGKEQISAYYPKESNPFLGDNIFELKVKSASNPDSSKKRKSLEQLLIEESKNLSIASNIIKSKTRIGQAAKARISFIKKAVLSFGYSQAEVAKFLSCDQAYISRLVVSHVSQV